MSAPQYAYSTQALPSPRTSSSPPPNIESIANHYATLRLEGLQTFPNAFGSSYAIESTFTLAEWVSRFWRDDAVVLVCIAHPVSGSDSNTSTSAAAAQSSLEGEWVGSAILRGPMPAHEYALPPQSGAPPFGSDDTETKWQMTAVYASASHRGRGIGKMLVQAAKDFAKSHSHTSLQPGLAILPRPTKLRIRAIIHPDNLKVLSLYEGAGFVDVGRINGKEAYRTNGDSAFWEMKLQTLSEEMKVYWSTAYVGVVLEWKGEIE
ncbi:N-acetyltransferase domain-containing protein [Favolaschia claudopus]|uniref:N-acetyltransferase domain-containing protein n=1 Tax=Favolaschia claudopus TaxID=2862362 RepID=A0AAW0A6H8_9AGAR